MRKTELSDRDSKVVHVLKLIAVETEKFGGVHTARVNGLLDLLTSTKPENLDDSEDAMNAILERYNYTPRFWCGQGSAQVVYDPTRSKLTREQAWEHWAVGWILRFSQDPALLSRIRRCAVCDMRFLATRNDERYRFCEGTCRQKLYDRDPERKKARNLYARKHYREQQQRINDSKKKASESVRPSQKAVKT